MKQRLFLFVVFSIIGISCDPSNVTGIVVGGDFLPLTAGNLWEYRVTVVGGSGDTTVPVTVTLSSPVTSLTAGKFLIRSRAIFQAC